MFIEEGEIINIRNKEYIVVHLVNYANEKYAYLVSNFKPLDIVIAKVTSIVNNSILEEVTDQVVLKEILKIISQDV